MSAPRLCVVTDEWCEYGDVAPCQVHPLASRCNGCNGPTSGGTRTVHTPAPDGSVMLNPAPAEMARWAVSRALGTCRPAFDIGPLLDALGVER